MKVKKTVERIDLYVPFTRVDDAERIVEGYCFVNEVVQGEGGVRLKRSAMKAATEDYMRGGTGGALREMHQPIAAGLVPLLRWEDDGRCFVRAKVVDDQAWKKVTEKVYRGFSVGVLPTIMRGLDIDAVVWPEISLVDRHKDPDAVFTMFRSEDAGDRFELYRASDGIGDATSIEIEVDDADGDTTTIIINSADGSGPEDFTTAMSADVATDLVGDQGWDATWTLWDVLYDIAAAGVADAEDRARKSIQQFADYVAPMVAGNCMPLRAQGVALPKGWGVEDVNAFKRSFDAALIAGDKRPFTLDGIQRVEQLAADVTDVVAPVVPADNEALNRIQGSLDALTPKLSRLDEIPALLTRFDGVLTEFGSMRTGFEQLVGRVALIEKTPVTLTAPVRFASQLPVASPVERSFAANENTNPNAIMRDGLNAELKRLTTDLMDEPDEKKRMEGASRMQVLKMLISNL